MFRTLLLGILIFGSLFLSACAKSHAERMYILEKTYYEHCVKPSNWFNKWEPDECYRWAAQIDNVERIQAIPDDDIASQLSALAQEVHCLNMDIHDTYYETKDDLFCLKHPKACYGE